MGIHPDIKKAIEIIDQRIDSLRHIRDSLAHEFGMDGDVAPSAPLPLRPITSTVPQLELAGTNGGKTSKDRISEFLSAHGPTTKKQIMEGTGIPEGTVGYALNDKTRFRKTDRGWENVSEYVSVT